MVEYYTNVYICVVQLQHSIQHPLLLSEQLRVLSLVVMFLITICHMQGQSNEICVALDKHQSFKRLSNTHDQIQ